jgi:hypothetical protein
VGDAAAGSDAGFVSLGSLDTYTRNFGRFAQASVKSATSRARTSRLKGNYERIPTLFAQAARQRCRSGTVPACFRWTIGALFGRPKREKPRGFCRVFGPLTAGTEAHLFLGAGRAGLGLVVESLIRPPSLPNIIMAIDLLCRISSVPPWATLLKIVLLDSNLPTRGTRHSGI